MTPLRKITLQSWEAAIVKITISAGATLCDTTMSQPVLDMIGERGANQVPRSQQRIPVADPECRLLPAAVLLSLTPVLALTRLLQIHC